jgi:hypothetical protein
MFGFFKKSWLEGGGADACLLPFLSVPVGEIHSLEKAGLWPKLDMEEEQKKGKDDDDDDDQKFVFDAASNMIVCFLSKH